MYTVFILLRKYLTCKNYSAVLCNSVQWIGYTTRKYLCMCKESTNFVFTKRNCIFFTFLLARFFFIHRSKCRIEMLMYIVHNCLLSIFLKKENIFLEKIVYSRLQYSWKHVIIRYIWFFFLIYIYLIAASYIQLHP